MQLTQKYYDRFELKYPISIEERDNLIKNITPFMKLDKYVRKDKKFYEVRSIYFDSPFRKAFLEKVNGLLYRYKLRLRYYPDYQDGEKETVFIEIKKKNNENVYKSRVMVPFEKAFNIINSNTPEAKKFYKNASFQDKTTLEEIWFVYKRDRLKPMCVVCYFRKPYMSKIQKTFRITFDTNIKIRDYNFDLHIGGGRKYVVPPNISVMEIKFNSFIPFWMIRIIQRNGCLQQKMSKFIDGLERVRVYSII